MGVINVPFAIPNLRCENRRGRGAYRVSAGSARCRTSRTAFAIQSFVAEIAHALGRDPKDMLLELIGPARIDRPAQIAGRRPTDRITASRSRPTQSTPGGCAASSSWLPSRRAGAGNCRRARPGHRRASLLRQLRRDRGRGRDRQQGQAHRAARRYRDRLRFCRQSGAHPLANRRRRGDGARASPSMARSRSRMAARSRTTSTASRSPASTNRRRSRMCTSFRRRSTCRRAGSVSRACRRSRRHCAMRSSPRPASASGGCRSAISWRANPSRRAMAASSAAIVLTHPFIEAKPRSTCEAPICTRTRKAISATCVAPMPTGGNSSGLRSACCTTPGVSRGRCQARTAPRRRCAGKDRRRRFHAVEGR